MKSSANLAALLTDSAARHPSRPALAIGSRTLHTYADLASRVARLAGGISSEGLAAGDRVAIVSRNAAQYIEALLACWHAGACAVPVNAKLHPGEMEYILQDCGARWAFVDAAWEAALSPRQRGMPGLERVVVMGSRDYERLIAGDRLAQVTAVDQDDPAWLFYTSGTTGRPKGVVLSHANLRAMARSFIAGVEAIDPGDAILHAAPLSHGSGLYVVPHIAAAAVNVVPESGGFDPEEIVALVGCWSGLRMFAAPTMVKRLVAHPTVASARLDHIACIVYGGGPMYIEDCKTAFAMLGPRLAQIYGQGESPMTITAMPRATLADAVRRADDARLGSVGHAQPGIELRIGGADDAPVPGEVGEVLVRGPTVMRGYWMNAEASAAALAGGWLHTGDLGCLDSDGFLTLKDRSKDLIISGGSNIYPREVEEVLLRHASVAEAAVVGRRHEEWGEEVIAFVVPKPGRPTGSLKDELDRLCMQHIARFKRPRGYVFVDELPKNSTGKILKTALRDTLAATGDGSDSC